MDRKVMACWEGWVFTSLFPKAKERRKIKGAMWLPRGSWQWQQRGLSYVTSLWEKWNSRWSQGQGSVSMHTHTNTHTHTQERTGNKKLQSPFRLTNPFHSKDCSRGRRNQDIGPHEVTVNWTYYSFWDIQSIVTKLSFSEISFLRISYNIFYCL